MSKTFKILSLVFYFTFIINSLAAQQWQFFAGKLFQYSSVPDDWIWRYHINDKMYVGDFTGNGNHDALIMNGNRSALLKMDWNAPVNDKVVQIWRSNNNYIGSWQKRESDHYLTGDFNGDGKDDILCISPVTNCAMLLTYGVGGGFFYSLWSNNCNGWISSYWQLKAGDKYVVGDFSGRGRDEILCISQDGWNKLLYFNGSVWINFWSNDGITSIGGGPTATFLTGKFLQASKDELLSIGAGTWATIRRFNTSRNDWDWMWSQYGAVQFAGWELPLNNNDQIVTGNFSINNNYDEIFFVRQEGRSGYQLPARLIGVNSEMDYKSYWYNNKNNMLTSGYTLAKDRNSYYKIKYNNTDYLFRFSMSGSNAVTTTYEVFQYNNNLAKSSGEALIKAEAVLSPENQYILYPNPSHKIVNIERYSAENSCNYQIFNMLGIKIREGYMEVGQLSEKLDLNILTPGTYMVRLIDGSRTFTKKLIVN